MIKIKNFETHAVQQLLVNVLVTNILQIVICQFCVIESYSRSNNKFRI